MQEPLNEEMLEQMYWEFDTERNKGNRSERDVFKGKMRYFATEGHNETAQCNVIDPFPLDRTVMPLVRVMQRAQLSWAEREEIAWAIQECLRQHKSLMDEHEHHRQAMCCNQKAPNA